MGLQKRVRVRLSSAAYNGQLREESDTEAISIFDSGRDLVMEITPCPRLGVAHVVTMTEDQARRVSEYSKAQSKMLRELGRTNLLLDITYVPARNWNRETLRTIPSGSALFPVLDAKTVPINALKTLLLPVEDGLD